MMQDQLKQIYKACLVRKVIVPKHVEDIFNKMGHDLVGERIFFYGARRRKARSLKMESAPGTAETVIQLLQQELAGSSILDFGCGQHQSQYLKQMGFKVHSADVIDFNIPDFMRIDPLSPRLPFEDKQFDVTVASEMLEHVESPWEILKELARVTKRSIIFTTPNTMSKKSRKRFFRTGFLYWFTPENFSYHITPIFPWQVELFCKRHGFKLGKMLGNHQVFGLNDHGRVLDYAESLIFRIDLSE